VPQDTRTQSGLIILLFFCFFFFFGFMVSARTPSKTWWKGWTRGGRLHGKPIDTNEGGGIRVGNRIRGLQNEVR